jgi:hypothetical protein
VGAAAAAARAAQLVGGAIIARSDRGGMVCVRLTAPGPVGPLAAIAVHATACALASGG